MHWNVHCMSFVTARDTDYNGMQMRAHFGRCSVDHIQWLLGLVSLEMFSVTNRIMDFLVGFRTLLVADRSFWNASLLSSLS